jgi:phytoene/squalene synthetase
VYALAEKYNLKGLKTLAEEKFGVTIETLHPGETLRRTAHIAYTTTPDADQGLRQMVGRKISTCLEVYGMLRWLDRCLETIPSLAYDVLQAKYKEHGA